MAAGGVLGLLMMERGHAEVTVHLAAVNRRCVPIGSLLAARHATIERRMLPRVLMMVRKFSLVVFACVPPPPWTPAVHPETLALWVQLKLQGGAMALPLSATRNVDQWAGRNGELPAAAAVSSPEGAQMAPESRQPLAARPIARAPAT